MNHKIFTHLGACFLLLLGVAFTNPLWANIACNNPFQNTPGQLSPTDDCEAFIDDNLTVDDGSSCVGPFSFIVRDNQGNIIIQGNGSVSPDLSNYLGQLISIETTDIPNNMSCVSYYLVQDKQAPTMSCPMAEVACNASTAPAAITPIVVTDNCDNNLVPTYVDVPQNAAPDCGFTLPYIGKIDRNYTVTDASNNTSTCTQEIFILRPSIGDVQFPPNITIDCEQIPTLSLTGRPSIGGNPLSSGGWCNMSVGSADVVSPPGSDCSNYVITRNWTVTFECTGETANGTQTILVSDTTVPDITCPGDFTISTDGGDCTGSVTLPTPTVSDNCNSFTVTASIDPFGSGFTYSNLTPGVHTINYSATDACGMMSMCTTEITVVDGDTPSAVCDGVVIISLPSNGVTVLNAETFDDGSEDNCSPLLNFTISKEGGPFENTITFDCDDLATDTVMVTLMVTVPGTTSSNTCMNQVVVQDKIAPLLTCPGDLTIDCEANMDDLLQFGMATASDGCGFDQDLVETVNINQCGTGLITRVFTVEDPSGNSNTCTQTIMVENQTPFDGTGIVFPDDYTVTNGCVTIDDLEPGDLPAGLNGPTLPSLQCAMLATSFTDQLFEFDYPACYKIVRTWRVMDMCQFTPGSTTGIWSGQQVIAVMDNLPPTIDFCPPNDTFGLTANCGPATVTLMPVLASATCVNEDIIITNDSPYADAGNPGSDASGIYPEGEHTITFTVTDGCGNETTCSTTILVGDLKNPTPYCTNGTIAELQFMPPATIMASVTAPHLNFASFDNCTPASGLKYFMRRAGTSLPLAPSLVFDCADIGENQIELWVTDEAGNSDFCVTTVIVQDNMNLCNDDDLPPPLVAGIIGGGVLTTMGEELPGVHVDIPGMDMEEMTDELGDFTFGDLEIGNTYLLEPWKNDDPKNGITTFDLVLMSKHVLNISPLGDPYKIIAADVNNSGAVTTADIVQLQKLLLNIYTEFPNNTSWRFVRSDYEFPDEENPFDPAFPESYHVPDHDEADVLDADFVAVKIGDLNGSAAANLDGGADDRSWGGGIDFSVADREYRAGEEFTVDFRLAEAQELHALQFTLEFETDLELQGIEKGDLMSVAGDRFEAARQPMANAVTGAWYHTAPVKVTSEDVLFSLRFKANRHGRLSEILQLNSSRTASLAYAADGMEQDLNLKFENNSDMSFQLFQNQPNPFKKLTHIGFNLPDAGPAKLTVFDITGSVVNSWVQNCEAGFNQISIQRGELPVDGVLYYQLESANHTATKKMIFLQ